ncbi:helix-turn-helix domain-containing protein [Paenibacillus bovis]|uniref:AraC family transcriptional regulator n=1 Tax=Paenibacillus bovis TaxID=1616788 RepID=A0A172ZL09_9BACL|nr:AraC family transcriptional regulator [Paenibacillus bovis]ANF98092.1 AraC family transcriptional regulator [Paenibacillus bovis]
MTKTTVHSTRSRSLQGGTSKRTLTEIRSFMEQHYNEPISIQQLADMANLSPKYFVDLFKKTFQQSAMDYLTDIRIAHAKRCLTETGKRLRDIAISIGYSDEFYFSRKFKKEVGVSPSEYAKNTRKVVAACCAPITGYLLALHIIPAAAPLDPKWTAYYYNAYRSGIRTPLKLCDPYTSLSFEANVERLIRTRPDMIIGTDRMDPADQQRLQAIAPSLFVAAGEMNWQEQLRIIGSFVGREEQAESWISRYQQRVQLARERIHPAVGSDRLLVLRIYGEQMYRYSNRGLDEVLYEDLQLRPACPETGHRHLPVTLRELEEMNPERILVTVCPESGSRASWLALQYSEGWKRLHAVRNLQVSSISSDPWCEYSALAIMRMLDEAELLFTGNCPNSLQDTVHGHWQVK